MLICDKLTMLVTSDPVTELDSALNYAAQRLRQAATNGDDASTASLLAWIDHRLDERLTFTARDAAISLAAVDVIGRPRGTGRLTCSTNSQSESVTAPRRSLYDRQ